MKRLSCFLLALAYPLLSFPGCSRAPTGGRYAGGLYIRDMFAAVMAEPAGEVGSFTPHFEVSRRGIAHDAMILKAQVSIRARLMGTERGALLEGVATQVYNIGDGIQFELAVVEAGTRRVIYSRYFDAGRKAEDRNWIPFSIPLESAEGHSLLIEFRAAAGPQGDLVADWLAIGSLRVVQRAS